MEDQERLRLKEQEQSTRLMLETWTVRGLLLGVGVSGLDESISPIMLCNSDHCNIQVSINVGNLDCKRLTVGWWCERGLDESISPIMLCNSDHCNIQVSINVGNLDCKRLTVGWWCELARHYPQDRPGRAGTTTCRIVLVLDKARRTAQVQTERRSTSPRITEVASSRQNLHYPPW
ncbi:hypothetical protein J6590_047701 [Homalodisca vitripennis]|nr:hypothetical protein J6590_047701 [Homalodisca vitripennis]